MIDFFKLKADKVLCPLNIRIIIYLFCFLLTACAPKPPTPPCQIDPQYKLEIHANGGCFIKLNDRLLVIRQRFSGKISLPGGSKETGESVQCTAHRETWEEAGANVLVGSKLHVFNNNFHLFECILTEEAKNLSTNDQTEIKEVLWIEPKKTKKNDWRFSNQYTLILKLFKEN